MENQNTYIYLFQINILIFAYLYTIYYDRVGTGTTRVVRMYEKLKNCILD